MARLLCWSVSPRVLLADGQVTLRVGVARRVTKVRASGTKVDETKLGCRLCWLRADARSRWQG